MAKIIFRTSAGDTTVEAKNGETLLEVAERSGVSIFGGCGGAGVCGSCHVFIDQAFVDKLSAPTNEEQDLLEILPNGKVNSRLACQVKVSDILDGMVVSVP
ncbi:MAG: 2Fe-2S iron-sulfur cluster binding domain-containing protein [Alphaproteobacteria bacterium]|nr:2Fe-2S iron-sulfur cluster binding domain-containing protein [Alphaproteobacteria bacterium]